MEEPTLGCGERYFVVTSIGPERVRLFSCAPLVEIEVARREFDERAEDYESDPATVLAILRRNAASASRHRLEFDKQAGAVAESPLAAESPEVGDPWRLFTWSLARSRQQSERMIRLRQEAGRFARRWIDRGAFFSVPHSCPVVVGT